MGQKLVSFKVAKALKEAGYPQEYSVFGGTTCHYKDENTLQHHSEIGCYENIECAAPTYTSAWLWLVREKDFNLSPIFWHSDKSWHTPGFIRDRSGDPEDAIISAIDFLVENNLIK